MDIKPPERGTRETVRTKRQDRPFLRIAAWAFGAAIAVTTLTIVAQSPAGGERIQLAVAAFNDPAGPVLATDRPQADSTVRTLEARIAQLTADRDRLATRLATLETSFTDLTGSVRKQASADPAGGPPAPTAVHIVERVAAMPMVVAVAPPMINPLATPPAGIASILPETPAAKAEPTPAAPASAAVEPVPAETAVPDVVPLPRERVAAVEPPNEASNEVPAKHARPAAAAPPRPQAAEYGIELATEPGMDGLRRRWVAVKANYGPLLTGLNPVAVRDSHPGSTAVRLVAGPLPSLAEARKLCARFAAVNGDCWPARINPADIVQH